MSRFLVRLAPLGRPQLMRASALAPRFAALPAQQQQLRWASGAVSDGESTNDESFFSSPYEHPKHVPTIDTSLPESHSMLGRTQVYGRGGYFQDEDLSASDSLIDEDISEAEALGEEIDPSLFRDLYDDPRVLSPRLKNPLRDVKGRSHATGRRKESLARVWVQPGSGNIFVNRRPFVEYFPGYFNRGQVLLPLQVTDTIGQFDVWATAKGGGLSGQSGAIRLGLARAIARWDPVRYNKLLKAEGLLTRDPRVVERKKPGKVKARKSATWVRR